jgi:putative membrane protein
VSLNGGPQDDSWRRLSARMLLVHPVRELGQAIPALIGLVLAGRAVSGGQAWWVGPVGVVVVIAVSVLRWMTTRYRITPEQVQLRTGLLQRKTTTAPADRVRSVDVTASALHRLLGLAKVDIGTASHGLGSGLSLDALPVAEAAGLRAELLHRSAAASADTPLSDTVSDTGPDGYSGSDRDASPDPGPEGPYAFPNPRGAVAPEASSLVHAAEPAGQETELARLDPSWVRFAPFTMSGVLGAGAVLALGSRLLDQSGVSAEEVGPIRSGLDYLQRTSIWLDVLLGAVGLAFFVTVLSVGGYALSYWGFRLVRHSRGTLHVTRGLVTTRAISIEERRLRGVEVMEPILLRAVGGARLGGITTGLRSKGAPDGGSSLLLPPAPRRAATEVAARVLQDPAPGEVALTVHGPAARRRRYVRALLFSLVLVVAAAVAIAWDAPVWLAVPAVLTIPVAVLLAADRYRSLGHAVAGGFLVTRAGSMVRRRDMLECEGIIGWNLRQTFFQRRAGLATLTATTAAGRQRYVVRDVPLPLALSLADHALPGLLSQFLAPNPQT